MLNRKLLKYFLYLLISLIAIISLSLFALTQLISPERYKPLISQLATQEIGAKLEIGSINWDLWPSLALTAHNVSLSNNNQILTTPLASASTCEVILQLKPLLHGQIYIDKVILHNPKLSLITDGNNNNWDFTTPPTAHNTSMIMQLSSIKLKNASVEYQDFSQGKRI
jgi:AsmA protein